MTRLLQTLLAGVLMTAAAGCSHASATAGGTPSAPAGSPQRLSAHPTSASQGAALSPRRQAVGSTGHEGDAAPRPRGRGGHGEPLLRRRHRGATSAYINSLAHQGALFTKSYAVTHPSEPNYLALYSGSTQGLTDDSCPHTYSGANLGQALLQRRRSFVGYSEGLPATGAVDCTHGAYARKHNPWVKLSLCSSCGQPATDSLPGTGLEQLPRMSFVVPDLNHDMHDGTVAAGDQWLKSHLGRYAAWAPTHNSLLVLTWDEDDRSQGNHIATIVLGAHVRPGLYGERVDHYRVLRMLTDLEGVPAVGRGATARPVTSVWTP